jgi:hypothetical protein
MITAAPSPDICLSSNRLRPCIHHSGMHVTSIDLLYTDHVSDLTFLHLERVGADLKIRQIFSMEGKPRLLHADLEDDRDIREYADYPN